jgi:hypothetical protein
MQDFIERRGEGYYFIGSRVSLDSVVYQFLQGESPVAKTKMGVSNPERFLQTSLTTLWRAI